MPRNCGGAVSVVVGRCIRSPVLSMIPRAIWHGSGTPFSSASSSAGRCLPGTLRRLGSVHAMGEEQ